MYIIKNAIYVKGYKGYIKCVLHKLNGVYYLKESKVVIDDLPAEYSIVTWDEIVAKYGADAVEDIMEA